MLELVGCLYKEFPSDRPAVDKEAFRKLNHFNSICAFELHDLNGVEGPMGAQVNGAMDQWGLASEW